MDREEMVNKIRDEICFECDLNNSFGCKKGACIKAKEWFEEKVLELQGKLNTYCHGCEYVGENKDIVDNYEKIIKELKSDNETTHSIYATACTDCKKLIDDYEKTIKELERKISEIKAEIKYHGISLNSI